MITLSAKLIKVTFLALALLAVLTLSLISNERPTFATNDSALEQIAGYKTWTKVTDVPLKVDIDLSAGGG